MVSKKEAKENLKTAEKNYRENPTIENEQAVLEAKYIVGLVIGIYLFSALLPSAISALNGANVTGWTPTQVAIYGVISIVILAVIIMKISE
jgi:hypothetical protein